MMWSRSCCYYRESAAGSSCIIDGIKGTTPGRGGRRSTASNHHRRRSQYCTYGTAHPTLEPPVSRSAPVQARRQAFLPPRNRLQIRTFTTLNPSFLFSRTNASIRQCGQQVSRHRILCVFWVFLINCKPTIQRCGERCLQTGSIKSWLRTFPVT